MGAYSILKKIPCCCGRTYSNDCRKIPSVIGWKCTLVYWRTKCNQMIYRKNSSDHDSFPILTLFENIFGHFSHLSQPRKLLTNSLLQRTVYVLFSEWNGCDITSLGLSKIPCCKKFLRTWFSGWERTSLFLKSTIEFLHRKCAALPQAKFFFAIPLRNQFFLAE